MITRSFANNFEVVDYTEELLLIPNQWGLVNELGIFNAESVSQHNVIVETNDWTLTLIGDQVRGGKRNANSGESRRSLSFPIPHFPLDDYIGTKDLQGQRAYGSPDMAETEAAVMERKLRRIRAKHAATLEAARCKAITDGIIYAPNGTVAANYYTDFGITRKEVDFLLGTSTTEVVTKIDEVVAHIQDNILSGETVTDIVGLCSNSFFAKLITHATVKEAYKYYSSSQEPLRESLRSGKYRRFRYGGVDFIDYRGSYNGTALIPAGDCYFVPLGTMDSFVTYYGPADKLAFANTLGEEAYVFTFADPKGNRIDIESESNHLHLLRRPQAIVRGTTSN